MNQEQIRKCIKPDDMVIKPCPKELFRCELTRDRGYSCDKPDGGAAVTLNAVASNIEYEDLLDYKQFSGNEGLLISRREIYKTSWTFNVDVKPATSTFNTIYSQWTYTHSILINI